MDKRKSLLNVASAIFFKVALLVFTVITKRFLIDYVGNVANGVNSLYGSIIGFLSIAELGVGFAISFSMYKPIVENDEKKIAGLYNYYKKFYSIVSLIIFICGLCIMPFLPYLAKGFNANFSLYLTFFISLITVVFSYFYSAKSSLINAYKNNYITTTFYGISQIIGHIIAILFLYFFHSFELYLVAKLFIILLHGVLVEIYARRNYKKLISTKEKIDSETKSEIGKNTKALLFHKIGGVLINSSDSLIISALISVILLGKYNNYILIVNSMMYILSLFFTPLTSTIGQMCVKDDIQQEKKIFNFFYIINFALGIMFFLGFYAVIDDVVAICFGGDLILSRDIPLIITINYFIQFMNQTLSVFKDATGCFYYDRFRPLIEGLVNIVLSLLLAYFMGIVGVIVATIITNLFIKNIIEPYVFYKHVFKSSPKKYYLAHYSLIIIFSICLCIVHFLHVSLDNIFLDFIANGFIAVGISLVPILIITLSNRDFREQIKSLFSQFFNRRKNKKKVEE